MILSGLPVQSCLLKRQVDLAGAKLLVSKSPRLLPELIDIEKSALQTLIHGPLSIPVGLHSRLKKLHLKECGINQAMLRLIAGTFIHLETFCVTNEKVDFENFRIMSLSPSLQNLKITQCRVRNLQEITHFFQLHSLEFVSSPLNNREMYGFESLTRLTALKADYCRIVSIGVIAIANLTTLEYLSLAGNTLDDSHVELLAPLPRLDHLDLSENEEIEGETFDSLACLEELKTLSLMDCRIKHGEAFEKMTKLESLHLNTEFPQTWHLIGLTHLTELTHPASFENIDLQRLGQMGNLVYLDLSEGFLRITQAAQLSHLGLLTQLHTLYLEGMFFEGEDDGIPPNQEESLVLTSALTKLNKLKKLSLTLGAFDKWIGKNLNDLKKLKEFTLVLKEMKIDGGVANYLSNLTRLTSLRLENCTLIGQAEANLEILELRDILQFNQE